MRLVLEGGGVRAAYSAGVLRALQHAGVVFGEVIGSSSGSVNAAFFAARQMDTLCELWTDWVPGTEFISWRRQLTPFSGPGLGIDRMLDDIIVGKGLLDCTAATTSTTRLLITATDIDTCQPIVVQPSADELITWLRASMAIPVGYNRLVTIDGRRCVDGGMAAPVAFDLPLSPPSELSEPLSGPAVVILTRPRQTQKAPPSWWERFFIATIVPRPARRASLAQHRLHNETMQRLGAAVRAGSALVIDPPAEMPIRRLTRDRATIRRGLEMGYEVGQTLAQRLLRDEERCIATGA